MSPDYIGVIRLIQVVEVMVNALLLVLRLKDKSLQEAIRLWMFGQKPRFAFGNLRAL